MPLYTSTNEAGLAGMLQRQCTKENKIDPVRRQLAEIREGRRVRLWYGISGEEMRRMRMSKVGYVENYYPLVFAFDRPWHRRDCLRWLAAHGYPPAPRSACLGCPYHSDQEWRAIRKDPEAWADVVDFDAGIRLVGGVRSETFLHRSLKPLPMVDLTTAEEQGQQNWLLECEGMCGV
jgi:hypothetical protein